MNTVPFEARRFQSTADFYLRYRIPYPDKLIAHVAERTGIQSGDSVLDLGCGPGQLGIAFAKYGARVTAMDPEPEMLAAARQGAMHAGVDIDVRQGSSYDLGPELGALKMVVMGRSFHWMDRPATLMLLDGLIEQGGAVALFHDRHVTTPAWRLIIERLAESYSPERSAERTRRRTNEWDPHETVLLQSPFRNLERIGIVTERHLTANDIVGRTYSMSVTSPQALGNKAAAFEADLRKELGASSPDGRFAEVVEATALLAFRN